MNRAGTKREVAPPESSTLDALSPQEVGGGGPLEEAMAVAGRLLARRPRTEAELRARLSDAGLLEDTVAETLERLRALCLVDDTAWARQWVEERSRTRARSGAALLAELRSKGVDRAVAEAVVADAGLDDEAQARAVAERSLPRLARHSPEVQALKLQQLLLRRGFEPGVAERATRALLPPEGWD